MSPAVSINAWWALIHPFVSVCVKQFQKLNHISETIRPRVMLVGSMFEVVISCFMKSTPVASTWVVPSRISGRGYGIGPVCLCVCQSALSWLNHLTQGHERYKVKFSICNEWWRVFQARILTKRARCGRARQRSGVFISSCKPAKHECYTLFFFIITTSPNWMVICHDQL